MPLLVLNLVWGLIEICLLVAVWRGARLTTALAGALTASFLALVALNGPALTTFHSMRAVSWALFFHAPLVLFLLAWRLRARRAGALVACGIGVLLAAVGVDAFLYEPHALVVSSYELKAATNLRIAVMSDFQANHIGDYERGVLKELGGIDADLVLLAGDYIQVSGPARPKVVADFREAWKAAGIAPRLGTYAVRGDVELNGWGAELFGGFGVTTSDRTRTVVAGDVTLTMLSLFDSANPKLSLSREKTAPGTSIVLGHRPDFALGSEPPALLVAGHTHGGQVQLPFFGPPIILSSVPRRWGAGGLFAVDDQRSLLVTRGAGVEHADNAPELRFGCRPELVALTLAAR